jgi:predicted aminopeptidase
MSVAVVAVALLAGCETLNFYRQAVSGQIGLLTSRTSVDRLLADPSTDPALATRLGVTREILAFAAETLDLPVDGRYSSYVALDRPAAVWVVYATPEFSVAPRQWCYPVIGCAAYRGYFNLAAAQGYAARQAGYDTHVGAATAYSTLGWFDDPLLSTFIFWPDHALAGTLFHELAHVRVYIDGDTALNESYATFVEREGTRAWLRASGRADTLELAERRWRDRDRFTNFMLSWRERFAELYAQPYAPFAMRLLKHELTSSLEQCYRDNREILGGGAYDRFFDEPINNARFVAMAVYDRLVPAFEQLFIVQDSAWPRFHVAVAELAAMPRHAREERLEALLTARSANQQVAHVGDHQRTDDVQCKTFAHHSIDAETAGTEHDDIGRGRDG